MTARLYYNDNGEITRFYGNEYEASIMGLPQGPDFQGPLLLDEGANAELIAALRQELPSYRVDGGKLKSGSANVHINVPVDARRNAIRAVMRSPTIKGEPALRNALAVLFGADASDLEE